MQRHKAAGNKIYTRDPSVSFTCFPSAPTQIWTLHAEELHTDKRHKVRKEEKRIYINPQTRNEKKEQKKKNKKIFIKKK